MLLGYGNHDINAPTFNFLKGNTLYPTLPFTWTKPGTNFSLSLSNSNILLTGTWANIDVSNYSFNWEANQTWVEHEDTDTYWYYLFYTRSGQKLFIYGGFLQNMNSMYDYYTQNDEVLIVADQSTTYVRYSVEGSMKNSLVLKYNVTESALTDFVIYDYNPDIGTPYVGIVPGLYLGNFPISGPLLRSASGSVYISLFNYLTTQVLLCLDQTILIPT
jgi:hypothetical protein